MHDLLKPSCLFLLDLARPPVYEQQPSPPFSSSFHSSPLWTTATLLLSSSPWQPCLEKQMKQPEKVRRKNDGPWAEGRRVSVSTAAWPFALLMDRGTRSWRETPCVAVTLKIAAMCTNSVGVVRGLTVCPDLRPRGSCAMCGGLSIHTSSHKSHTQTTYHTHVLYVLRQTCTHTV